MRLKTVLWVMVLIVGFVAFSGVGQVVETDTSRLLDEKNLFCSYADSNIIYPIRDIEAMFQADNIELRVVQGIRFPTDLTKRGVVFFPDIGTSMFMKIKPAPKGGDAINNAPRFEMAAYELQKLFLTPDEFVVPPTGIVGFSRDYLKTYAPKVKPTFWNTSVVITALQLWVGKVSNKNVYDKKRLETDLAYAGHFANLNLVTYLLKHSDANKGNVLISTVLKNPRLFSVDNGLIFDGAVSKQGDSWSRLRVKKFPEKTIDRLRQISYEDLQQQLETIVQFAVKADEFCLLPVAENFNVKKGVRRQGDVYQMGLTAKEILQIQKRMQEFLNDFENGRYSAL